ncbi:hypothetical protein BT69DRAFT_1321622 [Atractiella rhizophila]|nr:hypothetical protein BT69DRAFT_1321622 [Atractiella rhizophila]
MASNDQLTPASPATALRRPTFGHLPPELVSCIVLQLCQDESLSTHYLLTLSVSRYLHRCLHQYALCRPILVNIFMGSWFISHPNACEKLRFLKIWPQNSREAQLFGDLLNLSRNIKALEMSWDPKWPHEYILELPKHLQHTLITLSLNMCPGVDGEATTRSFEKLFETLQHCKELKNLYIDSEAVDSEDVKLPRNGKLEAQLRTFSLNTSPSLSFTSYFSNNVGCLVSISLTEDSFDFDPGNEYLGGEELRNFVNACAKTLEALELWVSCCTNLTEMPRLRWLKLRYIGPKAAGNFHDIVPAIKRSTKLAYIALHMLEPGINWSDESPLLGVESASFDECSKVLQYFESYFAPNNIRSLALTDVDETEASECITLLRPHLRRLKIDYLTASICAAIATCIYLLAVEFESMAPRFFDVLDSHPGEWELVRYIFLECGYISETAFKHLLGAQKNGLFPSLKGIYSWQEDLEEFCEKIEARDFEFSSCEKRYQHWMKEVQSRLRFTFTEPMFGAEDFLAGF